MTAAVAAHPRQRLTCHGSSIRAKSDPPLAGATDLHIGTLCNNLDRLSAMRTGNCDHAITVLVDVKGATALGAANLKWFLGRFLDVEVGMTVRTVCLNKEVVDDVSPPVDFKSPITMLAINEPGGEKPACFILFLCLVPTMFVVEDLFLAAVRASGNNQHLSPYIALIIHITRLTFLFPQCKELVIMPTMRTSDFTWRHCVLLVGCPPNGCLRTDSQAFLTWPPHRGQRLHLDRDSLSGNCHSGCYCRREPLHTWRISSFGRRMDNSSLSPFLADLDSLCHRVGRPLKTLLRPVVTWIIF